MTVLPATLMAFGNLTSENEITAMRSNGISLYRMIAPGLLLASLLAVGMILYNNHVLPESNHKLRNLLVDIYKKKPSIRIKENTFIDEFEGYTIYVREKNDKTGEIKDVHIFKNKKGALPTTIVAEKGMLTYLEAQHTLRFELENVEIHEMPIANDAATYRKTTSKNYTMAIEDVDRSLQRTEREYRGDREMNVRQMNERILEIRKDINLIDLKMNQTATRQIRETLALLNPARRKMPAVDADSVSVRSDVRASTTHPPSSIPRTKVTGAPEDFDASQRDRKEYITFKALGSQKDIKASYFKQIDRYKVEIYKKFSIPCACIVFVLIGAPIALRTGSAGMNTAIGMSISFFLIYYVCLIGGEKLADRGLVHPFAAMWGANIICGAAGLVLLRSAMREQGVIAWTARNPLRFFHRSHDTSHTR